MSDEQTTEEKQPATDTASKLRELLSEFPGSPSQADIDKMKANHGDVFVSALSDDEVFLFRSITRREHRELQAKIAEGKLAPDLFEDEVLKVCLLWKSVSNLDAKAGTVPALFEQVMQNSNFLQPQLLAQLVTKL